MRKTRRMRKMRPRSRKRGGDKHFEKPVNLIDKYSTYLLLTKAELEDKPHYSKNDLKYISELEDILEKIQDPKIPQQIKYDLALKAKAAKAKEVVKTQLNKLREQQLATMQQKKLKQQFTEMTMEELNSSNFYHTLGRRSNKRRSAINYTTP